jgi:hypothetical protein
MKVNDDISTIFVVGFLIGLFVGALIFALTTVAITQDIQNQEAPDLRVNYQIFAHNMNIIICDLAGLGDYNQWYEIENNLYLACTNGIVGITMDEEGYLYYDYWTNDNLNDEVNDTWDY